MTYAYVQAFHDYGPRKGPVKAFLVHMAEGGGTVGYLSRDAARGVSVHYVIEYSGRIVQMLREDHASGSIDPTRIRTTEGPTPFGATVRRKVMGDWDSDPNAALVSLEIEGFAAAGPNDDQVAALHRLVADVRTRYPDMGLLGHRDFADYKACPGSHIPWTMLGGHGEAEEAMARFPIGVDPKIAAVKPGARLYQLDLTPDITVSNAPAASSPFVYTSGGIHYRVVVIPTGGIQHLWLVKPGDCTLSPVPDVVDCTDEIAAAITADRAKAHITYA